MPQVWHMRRSAESMSLFGEVGGLTQYFLNNHLGEVKLLHSGLYPLGHTLSHCNSAYKSNLPFEDDTSP